LEGLTQRKESLKKIQESLVEEGPKESLVKERFKESLFLQSIWKVWAVWHRELAAR